MTHWRPPANDAPIGEAAQAWLLRLRSGAALPQELTQLQLWLAASSDHRRAFEQAEAVWQGVQTLGPMMGRLHGETAAEKHRRRIRWRHNLDWSSAMVTAALALLWLASWPGHWVSDLHTSVGQVVHTTLPDGTGVWLDTDSAVRLHYSAGERRVEVLGGQAWFDVKQDVDRPFLVQARDATITDVGTRFGVRLEAAHMEVHVCEGAVEVDSRSRRVLLQAGQGVVLDEHGGPVAPKSFTADQLSWQSGWLAFEGRSLQSVLAEIDRYWPGHIWLLSQTAAQRPVSAMLSLNDLEAGLSALARTQEVRIVRLSDYFLVVLDAQG